MADQEKDFTRAVGCSRGNGIRERRLLRGRQLGSAAALALLLVSGSTAFAQASSPGAGAASPVLPGDSTPAALTVPNAAGSADELADCLSFNAITAALDETMVFSGRPIGQWIAGVQEELRVLVSPVGASRSPDGSRLAVELMGCHSNQFRTPFTVIALVARDGKLTFLGDQAQPYLDGIFGGNYQAAYRLFGWLADSRTVLAYAPPTSFGGGGSAAVTQWASFGLDGRQEGTFWTGKSFALAEGNSVLFYAGPGGYGHQPQNEIHEVLTATGKDTLAYSNPNAANLQIISASQYPAGTLEVRYRDVDGAEQTLTVP